MRISFNSLFALAGGQIRAQADHDGAGEGSLAAAKNGGRANADSDWARQRDHDQVRGRIEHYGNRAQRDELEKDVSASVTYKLRDERQKEQRRFWIENFGGDSLP